VYDHVLVGTDGSATATLAVEAAARLAEAHQAKLTIVHAFKPGAVPLVNDDVARDVSWHLTAGTIADKVVAVAEQLAQAAVGGRLDIETHPAPGKPVAVLLSAIDLLQPDAVVVGNADVRRVRMRRSVGHALSRRVRSDVVIVDTASAA
jgi:nucleotide-binding universal stress UspA family protein